jgi:hypothetical protein
MHPIRTSLIGAAITSLALSAIVVAAPTASAEPTTTELCALATSDVVGKLQSSGALDGLVVQGVAAKDVPPVLAAAGARSKLNCGSVPKISASEARAKVCPQLTVAGVRAFAARLGVSPESQGKVTEGRVSRARKAVGCDSATTPTSSAKPTPTSPTPTPTRGNPGSPTPSSSSTKSPGKGDVGGSYLVDLDCKDFPTQAAAQKVLDKDRKDPHNLDRDNDGLACEQGDPSGTTRGDSTGNATGGSGDSTGAGSYGQVGDGDVPVGSIATGGR